MDQCKIICGENSIHNWDIQWQVFIFLVILTVYNIFFVGSMEEADHFVVDSASAVLDKFQSNLPPSNGTIKICVSFFHCKGQTINDQGVPLAEIWCYFSPGKPAVAIFFFLHELPFNIFFLGLEWLFIVFSSFVGRNFLCQFCPSPQQINKLTSQCEIRTL